MSRRGFTLIELLVVIAIIGVLVGLMLPAISRVQEVSMQTSCRNNLKQMGLALQGYHHAQRSFPSAYLFDAAKNPEFDQFKGAKTAPGWGWGTLLLPHIEQVNVYQRIDLRENIEKVRFREAQIQRMPVYECPSDQKVGVFWVVDEKAKEEGGLGAPIAECYTNSYAANYGTGPEIGEHPDDGNGLMHRNSKWTFRDIRDGVSNTMAIGERAADFAQAPWAGAISCGIIKNGDPNPAVDTPISAWMEEAPVQVMAGFNDKFCEKINGKKSNAYCFYTPHSNVINFVFADGAVRAINISTKLPVLQALSTRDNNEVVSANDF